LPFGGGTEHPAAQWGTVTAGPQKERETMGLDMYLNGRLSIIPKRDDSEQKIDGKRVKEITVELGYWHKHPDLHGYIVNTFAGGDDNCQAIRLDREDVEKIISAIENDDLAHGTEGFFFGKSYQPGETNEYGSYEDQKKDDLEIFKSAIEWLKNEDDKNWRDIEYEAS
jgi:hypothetical protein